MNTNSKQANTSPYDRVSRKGMIYPELSHAIFGAAMKALNTLRLGLIEKSFWKCIDAGTENKGSASNNNGGFKLSTTTASWTPWSQASWSMDKWLWTRKSSVNSLILMRLKWLAILPSQDTNSPFYWTSKTPICDTKGAFANRTIAHDPFPLIHIVHSWSFVVRSFMTSSSIQQAITELHLRRKRKKQSNECFSSYKM